MSTEVTSTEITRPSPALIPAVEVASVADPDRVADLAEVGVPDGPDAGPPLRVVAGAGYVAAARSVPSLPGARLGSTARPPGAAPARAHDGFPAEPRDALDHLRAAAPPVVVDAELVSAAPPTGAERTAVLRVGAGLAAHAPVTAPTGRRPPASGAVGALLPRAGAQELPLTADELRYAEAARAPNTRRGYLSDWTAFTTWCHHLGRDPLPAAPASVSGYLVALVQQGLAVGTISRRRTAIGVAHQLQDLPDPTRAGRVTAVWEGIRRVHTTPATQAAPLMPPDLNRVLAACPDTLAGLRDRAMLAVGFAGALRRSELVGLHHEHIRRHAKGRVLVVPRSKSNQTGALPDLVALPRFADPDLDPVLALHRWLDAAAITTGPVLRPVSRADRAVARPLHPESANTLFKKAVERAELPDGPWSIHGLRAGFVTWAHLQNQNDHQIAHQTRHRSLASVGGYVRIEDVWVDNAATGLGL